MKVEGSADDGVVAQKIRWGCNLKKVGGTTSNYLINLLKAQQDTHFEI